MTNLLDRIGARLRAGISPNKGLRRPDLPEHPTKKFTEELQTFNQKLRTRENFSLVRFGDGEMMIIDGKGIDLSEKYNGEHKYTPGDVQHEEQRKLLKESLQYSAPDYFVGIACPCCVGEDNFYKLKEASAQSERQLTWANLFVNANYKVFLSDTVGALAGRTINLVCHERADPSGLPLPVSKTFTVGANSWVQDYDRLDTELREYVEHTTDDSQVFLFCAGVLSNILIYRLAHAYPEHTYIDIGSVFDVQLGLGKTRKYLKQGKTLKRTCVWM